MVKFSQLMKNSFFDESKLAIYLPLALHQDPIYMPAFKRDHTALQNSVLWVIFAHLDPDPADQSQCGSRSTTPFSTFAFVYL
jgi:hypothetical protein